MQSDFKLLIQGGKGVTVSEVLSHKNVQVILGFVYKGMVRGGKEKPPKADNRP